MTTVTLMILLTVQSPRVQAMADLFDVLDKNGDGIVAASEISDAQQPYFQRSLRVADRNEDGALTSDELTAALTDPQPVEVTTSMGRGNFDPSVLDRNKDGFIAKEEIPSVLQERFKRAFEQYGDRIPVKSLLDMSRGKSANKPSDSKSPVMNRSEMIQNESSARSPTESQNRLLAAVKRFDTNGDGILNAQELKASPPFFRGLDGNKDGEISRTELVAAGRFAGMADGGVRAGSGGAQRPTASNAESYFKRLDRNKDGKLIGDEIPQRMRQVVRRADRDNDKAITLEEFRRAIELQSDAR
jgi:Ca2+-binding EF-hand superfamily protein